MKDAKSVVVACLLRNHHNYTYCIKFTFMNKVLQVFFIQILADFFVKSESKECTVVSEIKLLCKHIPVATIADSLIHRSDKATIEEVIIECDPQEKHFTLTILDKVPKLPSSLKLIGCNFSLPSQARILASLKKLDIRSSYTGMPQFDSYGPLEAFTFVNNNVLDPKDNAYHFVDFNFYDAEWCAFNENVSNCFCSYIDEQAFDSDEGGDLLEMSCFHVSAAAILRIVKILTEQGKELNAIRLYSVSFRLDAPTRRDIYFRSVNKVDYALSSFEIYTCSDVGNDNDSTRALRELRSIFCQFQNNNEYIKTVTLSDCAHLNVLQLLDTDAQWDEYEPFSYCMAPARFGQRLVEIELHNNNITMDQLRNVFGSSISSNTLEELNFAHNMMPVLEKEFGLIWTNSKLDTLNLSHCHINDIKDRAFDNLRYLEELDLHSNNLTFIRPSVLNQLEELRWLDLSHNRIYGVYSYEPHYSPIWPQDLLYLNLSNNILIDDRNQYEKGMPHVQFDANFFRGLENLHELSISSTRGPFESTLFVPLRSLHILNARNIKWTMLINATKHPNSVHIYGYEYLTSLRVLRIGNSWAPGTHLFLRPCHFFYGQKLLQRLEMGNDLVSILLGKKISTVPSCDATWSFYSWYMKRQPRLKLENIENTFCLGAWGEKYILTEYWAKHFKDSIDDQAASNRSSADAIDLLDYSSPQVVIAHRSRSSVVDSSVNLYEWSKIYIPLVFITLLAIIIVFIILPTNMLHYLSKERMINPRIKNRGNTPSRNAPRLKSLKREFHETTLFNGFAFIYLATWRIEKVTWYVVILIFACIFAKDAASLWVQFRYGDPQTSVSMMNAPTFAQNEFTVCMPIPDRILAIEPDDISPLFTPVHCEGKSKQAQTNTLDLDNRLAMLAALARLGMQMVYESGGAGVLDNNTNPGTNQSDVPQWMTAFDEMLRERNISYSNLMSQLSRHLCDYMKIRAFFHKRGNNTANRIEKLNQAGCREIFSHPIYGLTWYDQVATKMFCIRFPGLFDFDGYDMAGTLSLGPLYLMNELTHAKLDLNGYYDPLTSRKVGLPILAAVHHKTVLQIQVKSHIQNLQYFRTDQPRCYRNCIAALRVTQIENECMCRPLLWPEFADGELPLCTPDMYQRCDLASLGAFNYSTCAKTIPCDYWDYSVTPIDYGYTEDNSTQIVFGGANTMYVVYQEQEGKTLANFLGDVGGVLGLYLGASVMACIHVMVVFVKMIFVIIKNRIRKEDQAVLLDEMLLRPVTNTTECCGLRATLVLCGLFVIIGGLFALFWLF